MSIQNGRISRKNIQTCIFKAPIVGQKYKRSASAKGDNRFIYKIKFIYKQTVFNSLLTNVVFRNHEISQDIVFYYGVNIG